MNGASRLLQNRSNQITSRFGPRTIRYTSGPAKGQTVTKNHNGIDIVGTGGTLDYIVAHTAGTVKNAGLDAATGYYVQIQTASGALMVYYHMAAGSLKVQNGQTVEQGQVLGRMGATGNVTGAHLHFGIKVDGKWIDPEPYINADYEEEIMTQADFNRMMDAWLAEQARKNGSAGVAKEFTEAKALGITDGSRPKALCTREEAAVMALRAAKR